MRAKMARNFLNRKNKTYELDVRKEVLYYMDL